VPSLEDVFITLVKRDQAAVAGAGQAAREAAP